MKTARGQDLLLVGLTLGMVCALPKHWKTRWILVRLNIGSPHRNESILYSLSSQGLGMPPKNGHQSLETLHTHYTKKNPNNHKKMMTTKGCSRNLL